jgi:hypothetical protein
MARSHRSVLAVSLALATSLTAFSAPVARAQDMPFCAILTAEEVSGALGAQLAPNYGDERNCNYIASDPDVFTALYVTNGGTQLDIAKSLYADGADVTVAGQPGWLRTTDFDSNLYIDRGDGDTLSFQLLSPVEGVDIKAALEGLGALALPRLSTIPTPAPTAAPTPFVQQDAQLAARFPTEVGGKPVEVQTQMATPSDDAEEQAAVDALLASQGKTMADVSSGFAFSMDPAYAIFGIRIQGADAGAIRDPFLALSEIAGTLTPGQVAGKDVGVVAADGQSQYIYTKDDVIWLVSAEEPILTEIFQKLP